MPLKIYNDDFNYDQNNCNFKCIAYTNQTSLHAFHFITSTHFNPCVFLYKWHTNGLGQNLDRVLLIVTLLLFCFPTFCTVIAVQSTKNLSLLSSTLTPFLHPYFSKQNGQGTMEAKHCGCQSALLKAYDSKLASDVTSVPC